MEALINHNRTTVVTIAAAIKTRHRDQTSGYQVVTMATVTTICEATTTKATTATTDAKRLRLTALAASVHDK